MESAASSSDKRAEGPKLPIWVAISKNPVLPVPEERIPGSLVVVGLTEYP